MMLVQLQLDLGDKILTLLELEQELELRYRRIRFVALSGSHIKGLDDIFHYDGHMVVVDLRKYDQNCD